MTPTEFLLARIAEDEEVARLAGLGPQHAAAYWSPEDRVAAETWRVDDSKPNRTVRKGKVPDRAANAAMLEAAHIARHDPARVLAECEAKRRIVERFGWAYDVRGSEEFDTLRDLASVHADHPDYREEWKP